MAGLLARAPRGDEPRRRLLLALGSLGAVALAACSKDDDPAAAAPGKNHDKIADALDTLSAAVGDLSAAIDRFDDDNWREVVPDVRTAAEDVSNAATDLKDLLAEDG